jgi:hypothetical protein
MRFPETARFGIDSGPVPGWNLGGSGVESGGFRGRFWQIPGSIRGRIDARSWVNFFRKKLARSWQESGRFLEKVGNFFGKLAESLGKFAESLGSCEIFLEFFWKLEIILNFF